MVVLNTPFSFGTFKSGHVSIVRHFPVSLCVCLSPHRTILLSVISLLNEPNISSAANVDASVLYRKWRESRGKDKQFVEVIKYVVDVRMCFDSDELCLCCYMYILNSKSKR